MPHIAQHVRILSITLAAGCLTACTDFETPAELSHAQILAVRADPPVVAAGERARLSVLVAGPDGRIEPAAVDWTGPVEIDGDGAWYRAPGSVDAGGIFDTIEVAVELDDGTTLTAVKAIGVGLPVVAANPEILEARVDGAPIVDGEPVILEVGQSVELDLRVSPAPGPDAIFSWYATTGEIDLYRRSPTELAAPDEPATGSLFAVYRDGLGGVAWRELSLRIE